MTHNEQRHSTFQEGAIALFTGTLYGAVHTLTGHPLDTIKSKMQLQEKFSKSSPFSVARDIFKEFGFRGFYHGCMPPLFGSSIYRGVMLGGYELSYSFIHLNFPDDHMLKREFAGCIRPIVLVSVVFCSLVRGGIEGNSHPRNSLEQSPLITYDKPAPFEYAKIMGQTEQKWEMQKIFRGLHWQLFRTTALLLPIFTAMDNCRRKTKLLNTLSGHFALVFGIVGTAYAITWPIETLKNLAQAGVPHPGAGVLTRVRHMGGPIGLMRGVGPGALSGGMRNAFAMVAMVYAQELVTAMGWRDKF